MAHASARIGVCYYPEHWPEENWLDDAKRMRASGINVVRIGEFAWSRMEPDPGRIELDWLDRAIGVLGGEGLQVVMCTPTATPPKWLVDLNPDMLAVGQDDRVRGFGSRRHYCFSHQGYIEECQRITRILAERYGQNEHVFAWQIDNEYGCHDTIYSYSAAARNRFREWLQQKYRTIGALNHAWGNVFWSMEYRSFEEIELPVGTVTEANPSHCMDYHRFASFEVVLFNRAQTQILREHCPGKLLVHNFMGKILSFDHFDVGRDLDVAAWDAYPLGFLERDGDPDLREAYERQGDPDYQAFHHDLYRACATHLWVMELQPGPVNWAPYNPAPLAGMVRLWGIEAAAHGADVISYFRWRQAPFAQEQMHTGLLRADGEAAPGLGEAEQLAGELDELGALGEPEAPIGLVFDYQSAWAWEIQPHGADFSYFELVFETYRAFRAKGLSIDILPPAAKSWGKRKLVCVPGLFAWSDASLEALASFEGAVLIGPRTGSKTADFQIPQNLPPNIPADLFDLKVSRVESLRPGSAVQVGNHGAFRRWHEFVEVFGDAQTLWFDQFGGPALLKQKKLYYISGWPDRELWQSLAATLLEAQKLDQMDLPQGLRLRETNAGTFAFNYSNQPIDLQALRLENFNELDGAVLPPAGVAFARR